MGKFHRLTHHKLHWILDVIFNEDRSTLHASQAAQNMAVVRKLVLNMIRRYKEATGHKIAIKTVRKASGWSKDLASRVLNFLSGTVIVKKEVTAA